MKDEGIVIPAREVRRRFGGISEQTVWRWVRNCTLPMPIKINGRNFWRDSDIVRVQRGEPGFAA